MKPELYGIFTEGKEVAMLYTSFINLGLRGVT